MICHPLWGLLVLWISGSTRRELYSSVDRKIDLSAATAFGDVVSPTPIPDRNATLSSTSKERRGRSVRPKTKYYKKTDHLWLQRLPQNEDYIVWLDLENIRGKTGFSMTHAELLEHASDWAMYHNLTGHVVVVADHGSLTKAYPHRGSMISDDGTKAPPLSVVFSGDRYPKADDLLADWVGSVDHSVVVTADTELQGRCRKACLSYHILDPTKFLEDVEAIMAEKNNRRHQIELDRQPTRSCEDDTILSDLSLEEKVQLGQLDDEIRLRAHILDTQAQIDKKARGTNKRRKKLQAKLDKLQMQLARRGPSLLDQVTSMDNSSPEHTMILQRYKEMQIRSSRKEQTGDRVVLAEDLRRRLETHEADFNEEVEIYHGERAWSAQKFLHSFNARFSECPNEPPELEPKCVEPSEKQSTRDLLLDPKTNPLYDLDVLDICAISDTHGFEGQLVNKDGKDTLPAADVLMHLGDFSLDGSAEVEAAAWKCMDTWLAQQSHLVKIVVRGNHDPFHLSFPESGAWYITEPATIALTRHLTLGVIPYGSSRKLSAGKGFPKACDILASHVPPLKTLDRTITGKAAGSGFLNKVVSTMQPKPKLWLCGHIHEGRGVAARGSTCVINVANANRGRATHLDHGAVVVQVSQKDKVNVLHMEDKVISDRVASCDDFFRLKEKAQTAGLLLAIDLGLKSGAALFSSNGKLLRYEQFHFQKETLRETTKRILAEWEESAHNPGIGNTIEEPRRRITHVAIEGADSFMLRAWSDAAENLNILRVSPEEWRAELLLEKERTSGSNAKAASRLIARQVVDDFGVMPRHQGKFPTDVAEAVCLGIYVGSKLGWIRRDSGSIVCRYTNGNIMVPR